MRAASNQTTCNKQRQMSGKLLFFEPIYMTKTYQAGFLKQMSAAAAVLFWRVPFRRRATLLSLAAAPHPGRRAPERPR
jgi:hypothetical protein